MEWAWSVTLNTRSPRTATTRSSPILPDAVRAGAGTFPCARRYTGCRRSNPSGAEPWSVLRCTRAAARDVYGRAAQRMRGPPQAHARRTGAAGGGIECGVQARTRPRRDCVSWCWSLAARAAAAASGGRYAAGVVIESRPLADGAGSVPAPLAPQRGEPSRSASTWPPRGESGSSALPFHCPPCAPLPWFVVRAAPLLSGAVEPEVTRREMQAPGSALASTLLAASASARVAGPGWLASTRSSWRRCSP